MRPSWPGALARAVHPVRLGICLVGLAASLLLGATVQAVCAGFAFRLNDWWHDPLTEAQDLAWFLFAKGSAAAMVGGVVLVTVLWFVWSLVGGWIARSEFLRQAVTLDAGWADEPSAVTANQFLYRKGKTLLQFMPLVLSIVGFMLLPGVVAGWVNRFFGLGIGALALSVLLPVILIASLAAVLVLAGTLSCFIMPAALAAEGSDIFDVLSRGFSYVLQQPLQFAWWWGIALCLSGLPLAGVLW
ncbi:MAG TPA: hypothetical protein VGY58_06490, partial [Gemmataceae bacterium]|nr:hypothetical protein [Gemmataceae bacterium]